LDNDPPEIRLIWCSIPHIGGSPAGISLGNTSEYSCKMLEIAGDKEQISHPPLNYNVAYPFAIPDNILLHY
jgi:hypothetical protein